MRHSRANLSAPLRPLAIIVAGVLLGGLVLANAEDLPSTQPVRLSLRDTAQKTHVVPQSTAPTVLLFVRPDQEQSQTAAGHLEKLLDGNPGTGVFSIVSGTILKADLDKLVAQTAWPVVPDPDYALVGKLTVRVWPTTIVIDRQGGIAARLSGLPKAYQHDLSAYVAFAAGKIDRQTLQQRLAATEVIADTPRQMASRHLLVAERLLAKDLVEQAGKEVDAGLRLAPNDQRLLLAKARVLLLMRSPREALDLLAKLDAAGGLGGSIGTLRGGALVAMKRWDEAIAALLPATKLNPDPAEAYYYLGVAHQAKGQWEEAAQAFRAAFQATPAGRAASGPLTTQAATTQPAS